MEFEQLIKNHWKSVSNSSLTSFHYEAANGEKIDIDRPAGAAPAAAQGAAVTGGTASEAALAGTAVPAAAAVVPAAGTVSAAAPAEAAAGVLPAGAAAETAAAGTMSAAETASADSLKEGKHGDFASGRNLLRGAGGRCGAFRQSRRSCEEGTDPGNCGSDETDERD